MLYPDSPLLRASSDRASTTLVLMVDGWRDKVLYDVKFTSMASLSTDVLALTFSARCPRPTTAPCGTAPGWMVVSPAGPAAMKQTYSNLKLGSNVPGQWASDGWAATEHQRPGQEGGRLRRQRDPGLQAHHRGGVACVKPQAALYVPCWTRRCTPSPTATPVLRREILAPRVSMLVQGLEGFSYPDNPAFPHRVPAARGRPAQAVSRLAEASCGTAYRYAESGRPGDGYSGEHKRCDW